MSYGSDLDPDIPVEGDPPIDAQSMLEVIGETVSTSEARIQAARAMMLPYAVRAILNGTPAADVARACGFQRISKRPGASISMMDALMGNMGYRVIIADDVDEDDLPPGLYQASIEPPALDPEFVKWIVQGFQRMVTEGVKRV